MKVINHTQGSAEWLRWRNEGGVGGSDADSYFNWENAKYKKPMELWQIKTGRASGLVDNEHVRRGSALEPIARAAYEKLSGIRFTPLCAEHDQYSFIRASFDGVNDNGDVLLEIKSFAREDVHNEVLAGNVPLHYSGQLVQQLLVSGADVCHFVSYYPGAAQEIAVIEVFPEYAAQQQLITRATRFWNYVKADIPPPALWQETSEMPVLGQFGLVQLSGFATAGKDETYKVLADYFDVPRFAYADKLKELSIELGLWDGAAKTKGKARPKLVSLGDGVRQVYSDAWVNYIHEQRQDFKEAVAGVGAVVTDCRKVNELIAGRRTAKKLDVPHRLVWIERPEVGPANASEQVETTPLRSMADIVLVNDGTIAQLQSAVLEALGKPQPKGATIKASDYNAEREAA